MVDDADRDRDDRGIPETGDTAHDASTPTLWTPRQPIEVGETLPIAAAEQATAAAGAEAAADLESSRYRLQQVLGKGGMGEVVLALDQQIGREVAVKRIRSERPSPEEVARFVREARVQGRLEHPAVVPVYDLAVDRAGMPFFVMKRLAGTDLKELLERLRAGGEPDEAGARRRLLRAFVDVCLAVEFAHSRHIVHRDLKPANIMLGDFGEVYVLDWGIARTLDGDDGSAGGTDGGAGGTGSGTGPAAGAAGAASSGDTGPDPWQTRPGAILGTPAYMAPEQLAGAPAGPAADIYALGCILREIAPGVPELDALGARATANDPAARLASARALGTAVQAFLDGDRD
ncbi:MAG TPA: serine/threonine-protein kinase, partial [Kofleriaceae bacterium]|nr:serine/threonine-protein kinase [Kofleriaceae bacterium]